MSEVKSMRAMVLDAAGKPLRLEQRPVPHPGPQHILIRVDVCGVCRTDLHIVDGDLPAPKLPLILGHEIVGKVVGMGEAATRFRVGEQVGIPSGSRIPMVIAFIAAMTRRTCVNMLYLPATPWMAALRNIPLQMKPIAWPWIRVLLRPKRRRFFAPDSSGIALID